MPFSHSFDIRFQVDPNSPYAKPMKSTSIPYTAGKKSQMSKDITKSQDTVYCADFRPPDDKMDDQSLTEDQMAVRYASKPVVIPFKWFHLTSSLCIFFRRCITLMSKTLYTLYIYGLTQRANSQDILLWHSYCFHCLLLIFIRQFVHFNLKYLVQKLFALLRPQLFEFLFWSGEDMKRMPLSFCHTHKKIQVQLTTCWLSLCSITWYLQ